MPPSEAPQHDAFLRALLAGDRAAALADAREHFALGVAHLYEDVITAALVEVGELWAQNRISIADEHLATAIAQSAIASLYPEFPWPAGGPNLVVACPAGERHEIGARMFADLLALDGWHDVFLGADTPVEALIEKTLETRAVAVALSVTRPERIPDAGRALARLRSGAPSVRVLVGGRIVAAAPELARGLGADASSPTARGGVDAARPWKP